MIRVHNQKDGYAIKGITAEQLVVIRQVLKNSEEYNFKKKNGIGRYADRTNDELTLTESERSALKAFSRGLNVAISRLK